jgi:hypothetical protein
MPELFSLRLEGLSEAARIDGWIETAQQRMLEEGCQRLAGEVRSAVRSRSGRLAASWTGRALSSTHGVVETVGVRYARASVRGNYITPKSKRVLRFTVGGRVVFARFVRYAAGSYIGRRGDRRNTYVTRAMRRRNRVMAEVFQKHFDNLGGNRG